MKKNYTYEELYEMDAFQLWDIAAAIRIDNYEHMVNPELIDAILEKCSLKPETV